MSNICIIPARGKSQRVPRKNIKDFLGKPIIAYSIEAARQTHLFSRVVVSTDDKEIAEVAAKYGAEILIRPDSLAKNEVGTFEVVRHALACYANEFYRFVCCIYATSPMISQKDIIEGHDYINVPSMDIDHVVSIGYPNLRDAAQFYWSYAQAIWDGDTYFSRDAVTQCIKIDESRVCDINTPEDWSKAETMYKELKNVRLGAE